MELSAYAMEMTDLSQKASPVAIPYKWDIHVSRNCPANAGQTIHMNPWNTELLRAVSGQF